MSFKVQNFHSIGWVDFDDSIKASGAESLSIFKSGIGICLHWAITYLPNKFQLHQSTSRWKIVKIIILKDQGWNPKTRFWQE